MASPSGSATVVPEEAHRNSEQDTVPVSETSLHAPDEGLQWKLLLNFRWTRSGGVPGWLDRWNLLGDINRHPQSIRKMHDQHAKARSRRRVVMGIALHVTVITVLVTTFLATPGVETSLATVNCRIGFLVALPVEQLLVKLFFDVAWPRRIAFAIYTTTVALLIVSVAPWGGGICISAALGLMTLGWWLQWLLDGIQCGGDFLAWYVSGGISFLTVLLAGAATVSATMEPNVKDATMFPVLVELVFGPFQAYTIKLLYKTLPPHEAWMGVYFFHFDLVPGLVITPVVAILIAIALFIMGVHFSVKCLVDCSCGVCTIINCNLGCSGTDSQERSVVDTRIYAVNAQTIER